MPSKDFFKQLEDEFKNHPYKDRLLEELQDHLEDFETDDQVSPQIKERMSVEMLFGEASEFKKIFIQITDPWRNVFFISEALIVGIPLAVVGVMFYNELKTAIFGFGKSGVIPLGSLVIIGLMWIFGYVIAFNLFTEVRHLTNFKERVWVFFVTLPSTFVFLMTILSDWKMLISIDFFWLIAGWLMVQGLVIFFGHLSSKKKKAPHSKKHRNWDIFFFLPSSFLFTVLIFFDFSAYPKLNFIRALPFFLGINILILLFYVKKIKPKKNLSIPKAIGTLFFVGGVIAALLRAAITHTDLDWWTANPWLLIPLFPIFLLDVLAEMTWVFSGSNPVLRLLAPLGIMLFIFFQSLYVTVRRKKLLNDRFLVIAYAISFFFINTDAFLVEPEFKVDALKISNLIEREELSIFYPYVKYSNADKDQLFASNLDLSPLRSHLFDYAVTTYHDPNEGDYFVIENSIRERFFISINQLDQHFQSKTYDQLVQKNLFPSFEIGPYENIADPPSSEQGVSEGKIQKFLDVFVKNQTDPKTWLESVDNMHEFEREKLKNPYFTAHDYAFSEDKKWLLLVIPESSLGAYGIYLVKVDTEFTDSLQSE